MWVFFDVNVEVFLECFVGMKRVVEGEVVKLDVFIGIFGESRVGFVLGFLEEVVVVREDVCLFLR